MLTPSGEAGLLAGMVTIHQPVFFAEPNPVGRGITEPFQGTTLEWTKAEKQGFQCGTGSRVSTRRG